MSVNTLELLNNKCYNLINKLENREIKNVKLIFRQYYFRVLLPSLCQLVPATKIRFGATIPKHKKYITKVSLKYKPNNIFKQYEYIPTFIIYTHILHNKLSINASNFCFEIHISNKNKYKPRNYHVDKSNDIKFKSCISGYCTHGRIYLKIESDNIKDPIEKMPYNIDNKGSKRNYRIKNIKKNEKKHIRKIYYMNTFKDFDAACKVHKGVAVEKGTRIAVICYTVSNDKYKIHINIKNIIMKLYL